MSQVILEQQCLSVCFIGKNNYVQYLPPVEFDGSC